MKDRFSFYTEITKVEPQDDGTIKVYGVASSDAKDSDGEITNPEAFKAALPDFFTNGPALREMHQLIAAGKVTEANVDEAGKANIVAHVVDEGSVKKVKTGVLRGFSWKGPILKRRAGAPHILDAIKITEISLVDRPANPEALIELWKADKTQARALVAKKGMWDVARVAAMLEDLAWLQQCAASEAFFEGDSSEVPNQLRENVNSLAETLQAMLGEEIAELAASMSQTTDTGEAMKTFKFGTLDGAVVAAFLLAHKADAAKAFGISPEKLDEAVKGAKEGGEADMGGHLKKLGEAHKALNKHVDAIGEAHKGMIEECAKIGDMADSEPDEGKKAENAKARRVKLAADPGSIVVEIATKAAKLEGELAAAKAELAEKDEAVKALTKASNEMISRLGAKGVLRSVAIDKGTDAGSQADDEANKGKKDDKPTDPLAEIRAAHKDGERLQRVVVAE